VVDPDLVIISGRLADAAARYLLPAARATVNRARPLRQVTAPPRIDLGRVGPEAAAIGAAELALLIPAGVASSAAGPRSA
jgi:predicted NBD/HSP70 family sugar kinase